MKFINYLNEYFSYLSIENINFHKDRDKLEVFLKSNQYTSDEKSVIREKLLEVFPDFEIDVYIDPKKQLSMLEEVKNHINSLSLKKDVELEKMCLSGDVLNIFVRNEKTRDEILQDSIFLDILSKFRDKEVKFIFDEKIDIDSFYEEKVENSFEDSVIVPKKREVKIENQEQIGKFPKEYELVHISDLSEGNNKSVIEGKVYGVENGDIFQIQMKNKDYLVRFDLVDTSGAISCKYFLKNKDYESFCEICKSGNYAILSGIYSYDDYDGKNIYRINGITKGSKEKVVDFSKEKRIEFNVHTQMSNLDGLININDYVERLDEMDWDVATISDNFVVHGFPNTYNAFKKANKRLLLGMDGKILEDNLRVFTNLYDQEYSKKSFTVFDIETTGLSKYNDRITEIGAVRVEDGVIVDVFNELVNPEMSIPEKIVELTGITNEMVLNCDVIDKVLPRFIEFSKNSTYVAQNADFDIGFITENMRRFKKDFKPVYLDTMNLSRVLRPNLKNYKLNTLSREFGVSLENHHRASDDATATAEIFIKLLKDLDKENIEISEELNMVETTFPIKRNNSFIELIYAKNKTGLKNLYKLVSLSSIKYFFRSSGIPRSILKEHREGLLIGSGGHRGKLYKAVADGIPKEKIVEIAKQYDFLQIEPHDMYQEYIEDDNLIGSVDQAIEINKKIVEIGKLLDIPVIATGDVYYLNDDEYLARNVIKNYQRKTYIEKEGLHKLRTTDQMLKSFSYLGDDCYKVVVTNTHKLADEIEDIAPIPKGTFTPQFENAGEDLRRINFDNARKIYGDKLPDIVEKRLNRELDSIISNGYATLYLVARDLVKKSNEDGYVVGSRGSVGSSFVATMSDITEVNPLVPHYVCPKCKHSEFITDGSYSSGIDMPDKDCPVCGTKYHKDGQDIPFEVFLGFEGDKEPDIDLNFAGEYQPTIHKFTEVLFGEGKVYRAGTIGEIKEKTAYGYIKKYFESYPEEKGSNMDDSNMRNLARKLTGTKRNTGQHAGGIIIVPKDKEIFDFTPIQYPADDDKSDVLTTHFNYRTLEETLLKLDLLGHNVPSIIKDIKDLTKIDPMSIPLDDKETMSIFSDTEALDIKHSYSNMTQGTLGIPEFGTGFTMGMLEDTKPTTFGELVRISGLSHGTDVWLGNAQELIASGVTDLKNAICTRDDIMIYLISKIGRASCRERV